MATVQALNVRTSPSQRAYRITVWAGSESDPGLRADWVVYGSGITAVVSRAIRVFRRQTAKKRRFSDWTINVEPLRASETVVEQTALEGPLAGIRAGTEP